MVTFIFIIGIVLSSFIAYAYVMYKSQINTSNYYILIITFMGQNLRDKIPHEEFLQICSKSKADADNELDYFKNGN